MVIVTKATETATNKAGATVTFDENVTINQPEVEDAVQDDDKKYSLDSDEEDAVPVGRKLKVDDIDGQEQTTMRNQDGQAITPFNLEDENEDGHFDENGTFIFKKKDKEEIRDSWLDSIDMHKVSGEIPLKDFTKELTPDPLSKFSIVDIMEQIVSILKPTETITKALKRLGGSQLSASQRLKLKKKGQPLPDSVADKEQLEKLTSLADWLLHNGRDTVYQDTYEKLKHDINSASEDIFASSSCDGESSSKRVKLDPSTATVSTEVNWYYKVNGQMHGPLSSSEMLQKQQNSEFAPETEVCKESNKDLFYPVKRIEFDDYVD